MNLLGNSTFRITCSRNMPVRRITKAFTVGVLMVALLFPVATRADGVAEVISCEADSSPPADFARLTILPNGESRGSDTAAMLIQTARQKAKEGKDDEAIAHLERAVDLAAPAGASYWHVHALLRLAAALHRLGDAAAAADRLVAARADLDVLPDSGILGPLYEETKELLSGRARRDGFYGDELTDAELRIVRSLVSGASLTQVARELYLSPNTVKTHRRSIYRKLGVSTRNELLGRVRALGIAETEVVDPDRG
jgi:LuxR family maltose regulon positive regulatory protein